MSNEGDSYLLVALVGTVPIRFRTNQYNIPVEVFVVRDYPEKPPLCFVRPTRGMEIRPRHKHVDSAGQCYTPYLSAWQPARSDLLGLVTDLQTIFSTDPPVYAKPPSSSSLSPSSSSPSSSAQQPPPPTVAAAAKPPATPPPAYSPVGTAYGSQHPPAYGPPPGQPAHMGGGYPGHPHPHHQPHQPPPFASGQPEGGRKRELEERMARKANDVWQAVSADVNQFHLVQQRLRDGSSWLQHSLTTLAHDKVPSHHQPPPHWCMHACRCLARGLGPGLTADCVVSRWSCRVCLVSSVSCVTWNVCRGSWMSTCGRPRRRSTRPGSGSPRAKRCSWAWTTSSCRPTPSPRSTTPRPPPPPPPRAYRPFGPRLG